MSETFSALAASRAKTSGEAKRKVAVVAALELIAAAVANPSNKSNLEYEMGKISHYADLIQEAINKNDQADNDPD